MIVYSTATAKYKLCSNCNVAKPVVEFHKDASKTNGYCQSENLSKGGKACAF